MRVLYVSTRSDVIGGSNVHIRDMCMAMIEAGHSVSVIGGQEGVFAEDLRRNGIEYTPLRFMRRNIAPWQDARAVWEVRKHIVAKSPEILSLHTAKAGTIGRLAALGLGTPVVYTPHGWPFTTGVPKLPAAVYASIERGLAPLASAIVNVCEYEKSLALQRRVGKAAQHVTIHNGMPSVSGESAEPRQTGVARLVMVARFEEQKDHMSLLLALKECLDLDWQLDLIGSGPLRSDSEATVDRLGLRDRVSFLGARSDVAQLLAHYHLFILTSRWEGFPRSILEAMRAGLPVIASDVGGVHEAVQDGRTGYVVPVGDHETLVARIRALVQEPVLRRQLGDEGAATFRERFRFDQMFGKTVGLYERLLNRPT